MTHISSAVNTATEFGKMTPSANLKLLNYYVREFNFNLIIYKDQRSHRPRCHEQRYNNKEKVNNKQ